MHFQARRSIVFKISLITLLIGSSLACGRKHKDKKNDAPAPEFQLAADKAFSVKLTWIDGPQTGKGNRVQLIFTDANGQAPHTLTDIKVKPDMPIHGHGAPMKDQKLSQDGTPGASHVFYVEGINFVMSGPWVLEISATVNGHTDLAKIDVEVP